MERIGRYEITGEIGHGGMGVVYRGRDPAMRRDVAIKVLTVTSDPVMMARFRAEAGTTGNLRHKNIITVYDYGEVDGRPYLVMEFLEGRSLEQVIRSGPPLPLLEKTALLMQVAEGLLCAHSKGVVHRDVKPSNVMLLDGGAVKILDFGIARLIDQNSTRHTTPGLVIGTVGYMAPEQIQTGQADTLTDIFALGVTSYELLTGVHPFRADSVAATAYRITTVDPTPVAQLAPECPEALQHIVNTALAKARRDRYQNLQEVLFDLARVHATLRQSRTAELCCEAKALLDSEHLEGAKEAVDRLLVLEPAHTEGHELRRKIQRRREQVQLGETITLTQLPMVIPPYENAPTFGSVEGTGGIFRQLAVALLIIAALAAAGGYWFAFHPRHAVAVEGRGPVVPPGATSPAVERDSAPAASGSDVPYAESAGPLFHNKKVGYEFPGIYPSMREIKGPLVEPGFRNLHIQTLDQAGKPRSSVQVPPSAVSEWTHNIVSWETHHALKLEDAEYLTPAGVPGPEYATLALSRIPDGEGPPGEGREGVVQLLRLSDQHLKVVQQLDWSEQFESKEPYFSFEANTKTLTIRSAHLTPGDATCCASAVDIVTLRWDGTAFTQDTLTTELSEYGMREGKQFPAGAAAGSESALISQLIETWIATTKSGDLPKHLDLYSDPVDVFYTKRNLSRTEVEAEMRSLFNTYSSFTSMKLSDMSRQESQPGTVQVQFDKDYSAVKRTGGSVEGKVRSELALIRTAEGWKIRRERDLKVYFTRRPSNGHRSMTP